MSYSKTCVSQATYSEHRDSGCFGAGIGARHVFLGRGKLKTFGDRTQTPLAWELNVLTALITLRIYIYIYIYINITLVCQGVV